MLGCVGIHWLYTISKRVCKGSQVALDLGVVNARDVKRRQYASLRGRVWTDKIWGSNLEVTSRIIEVNYVSKYLIFKLKIILD